MWSTDGTVIKCIKSQTNNKQYQKVSANEGPSRILYPKNDGE
jgi:hypothetical protein